ncbi:type II toxin-antitoxin system toxin DNA ADP-ribosyl transferase DarT [Nibrella viscosa]
MPGQIPKTVWIFRIIPEQNLPGILQQGILTRNAATHDPNYVFIGDSQLTADRHDFSIPLPGYGNLGDYVPFYFGQLSPMLLNIKTGYRGITKRPQSEIIYLCIKIDSILKAGLRFVFTDGHAKNQFTSFYTSLDDLDKVDWEVVKSRHWKNTENDYDRQRRKQAEFLVYEQVSPELIDTIVVFNQEKFNFVEDLVRQYGLNIRVHIDTKGAFYY